MQAAVIEDKGWLSGLRVLGDFHPATMILSFYQQQQQQQYPGLCC
jgi:hypothetical protein